MKKILKPLLLVITSFIVSLVVLAPARLAYYFLPENATTQLNGVSGTIWSGKASQFSINNMNLGKLEWKINPLHFLKLRAGGNITLSSPTMKFDGEATINRQHNVVLNNGQAILNASTLPLPAEVASLVRPEGRIIADINHLDITDTFVNDADINVVWQQAAITEPMSVQLGEIHLDASGSDGDLKGLLSGAKNNPIKIAGSVDVLQGQTLDANIKISPTNNTPEDILSLLPLLGNPDQSGAVTVKYRGNIRL